MNRNEIPQDATGKGYLQQILDEFTHSEVLRARSRNGLCEAGNVIDEIDLELCKPMIVELRSKAIALRDEAEAITNEIKDKEAHRYNLNSIASVLHEAADRLEKTYCATFLLASRVPEKPVADTAPVT